MELIKVREHHYHHHRHHLLIIIIITIEVNPHHHHPHRQQFKIQIEWLRGDEAVESDDENIEVAIDQNK